MLITGSFKNIKDNSTIEVFIYRDNEDQTVYDISDEALDETHNFCFAYDPVNIQKEFNDFSESIITTKCTIDLISNIWCGELLFATDYSDIICAVYKDNNLVFVGYVEPKTYNQDINKQINNIQIQAIDILTVLTEYSYGDYVSMIGNAQIKSFQNILLGILDRTFSYKKPNNTIVNIETEIYVDNNIVANVNDSNINMVNLKVAESAFLGDSEDDAMHYDEIVQALLRYMNARIVSIDGQRIYILSNNVIGNYNDFYKLNNSYDYSFEPISNTIDTTNIANEQVSMDDVYNQIGIVCNIDNIDDVIEQPLEKNSLTSPYTNKQWFMREYSTVAKDNKLTRWHDFCYMVVDENWDRVTSEDSTYRDWYIRYLENPKWKLNNDFYTEYTESPLHPAYIEDGTYINQYRIMYELGYGRKTSSYPHEAQTVDRRDGKIGGPYFLAIGKGDEQSRKSNNIQPYVKTQNYLVIPVKGLWYITDDEQTAFQEYETLLAQYINNPMCSYESSEAMHLSPADDATTNYIVFSGKMRYNPLWQGYDEYYSETGRIPGLMSAFYQLPRTWAQVQNMCREEITDPEEWDSYPSQRAVYDNENDRYYYQRFITKKYPSQEEFNDINYNTLIYDFVPPIDCTGLNMFKYGSTKIIDNNLVKIDRIYKIPMLACRLQVGDKYLQERLDNETGISEYYWTTDPNAIFTLGIDPKIDDSIINKPYEISNNIDDWMNLEDAPNGTAIPITKEDNLNGIVKFDIIAPYNTCWNEATGTVQTKFTDFFSAYDTYDSYDRSVLNRVSNIFISDFKCEVYSDNAKNSTMNKDNDLIYLSENLDEFKNDKTDIDFDIYTGLTSEEAFNLGITTGISKTNVMNSDNEIYTTEYEDRPEVKFVQTMYDLYSTPKKIVTFDTDFITSVDDLYRKKVSTDILEHLGINPYYSVVTNSSISLYQDRINITLREL